MNRSKELKRTLSSEIDEISLARLRGECIQEVKRLNGSFSFEDAAEWQI